MADFLTRLASRTLGLAPMAEPIIASMFAPEPSLSAMIGSDEPLGTPQPAAKPLASPGTVEPQGALGLPPAPQGNTIRPDAPRLRPDPAEAGLAPRVAAEVTPRAAKAAPDDVIGRELPARQRTRLAPKSEIADEDALLMPAVGAPERQSFIETAIPAATLPSVTKPSVTTPSVMTVAEKSPDPVVRSAAGKIRAVPASWDGGPDEPLLLPLNPAANSPVQRNAPDPGPASRGRPAATPVDEFEPSRRGERGQTAAAAMPPAPSPTIEITIGRVEVRAVQPPAPVVRPQPAAPAAPRLSLEEYLRNQNGGRR